MDRSGMRLRIFQNVVKNEILFSSFFLLKKRGVKENGNKKAR